MQLDSNIKQLEGQLEKVKEELKVGVPAVKEEAGEAASEPLKQRLSQFVQRAEPRMTNIKTHFVETNSTLKTTMAMYATSFKCIPIVNIIFSGLVKVVRAKKTPCLCFSSIYLRLSKASTSALLITERFVMIRHNKCDDNKNRRD